MENDENILAHLSENVIKDKPIPNQTGNKAKTRIWTNKEMGHISQTLSHEG